MSGDLPDVDDSASQYVSIYLPNTQDQNYPQYHYLRIGSPDTATENNLPSDPNLPQNSNDTLGGISLYTTGSYSLTSPSATHWSSESLTAVTDGNNKIYTATYTTGAANGMRPATVTFQNVDQMANTAAASVNFLNGDALTFWNGNDQSLGIGGLLWANYGFTTNLFGGQIINLTNGSAEVQGFRPVKFSDSSTVSTTDGISLSVSPNAGAWSGATSLTTWYTAIMAILTTLTTGLNLAMTIELKTTDAAPGPDSQALKTKMQDLYDQQIAATALVTLIQASSVVYAAVLKTLEPTLIPLHSISIDPLTGITLQSGMTVVKISPAGVTMEALGSSLAIDDLGVAALSPVGIALMAAETSFAVIPEALGGNGPFINFGPG